MIYNVFYVKDAAGRPVGLATVSRDITERKRAERRSELMASTASQLLASDSPQRVIEGFCQKALALLDCHTFFNYLVDEGWAAPFERLRRHSGSGSPANRMAGLRQRRLRLRRPRRLPHRGENIQQTLDPRTELVKPYGLQAYACHPLLAGGGCWAPSPSARAPAPGSPTRNSR